MNKFLAILASGFILLSYTNLKADTVLGVTAGFHSVEASGTETLRTSAKKTNGSITEDSVLAEIFLEGIADNGYAVGIAYIPTRDAGAKSRTDSNSNGDSGTYKAEAELDNVIQAYVDVPFTEYYGATIYGKLGIQHATVKTLESLNSGSSYPDTDMFGYTLGLGARGDLPYGDGLIYKLDLTYTDFEDYSESAADGNGNSITADLEDTAFKISVGKKF